MKAFSNIILACDFLCTKESEQESNLKWLVDVFARPLRNATNPLELFPRKFSREMFFKHSGIKCNLFTKHFHYEAGNIVGNSIDYLREYFDENTLIIGYELSPQTRDVLTRAGLTYLDIWLHPVRYLDDILFAMRSNNEAINKALKDNELDQSLFYTHADLLRVQNYRGFKRLKDEIIPNSALFIGQLLDDKAIMKDGSFLNLLNFKDRFKALTKTHAHVYYIRHPFLKAGDEAILKFVEGHRNASLLNLPTYHLLASNEVESVETISSSVATEAIFFDKKTALYHTPAVEIREGQTKRYYSIDQSLLFDNFWRRVLFPVIDTTPFTKPVEFASKKDKLRDALSFYWGYREIDKVESLKITVAKLFEKKVV
jgi:hypothetical protein